MMAPDRTNGFHSPSLSPAFGDLATDPEIQRLVSFHARRLSRFSDDPYHVRKDFEQALYLHLLDGLKRFDPQVGSPAAFANTILTRRAVSLIRDSRAAKRYCKGIKSLSACFSPPDATERSTKTDPQDQENRGRHRGATSRCPLDIAAARMDLEQALNGLSPKLRRLAELLQTFTPTEVAGIQNRPRTSVQADIQKIRRRFEKRGLQKYFD